MYYVLLSVESANLSLELMSISSFDQTSTNKSKEKTNRNLNKKDREKKNTLGKRRFDSFPKNII